VADDAGVLEAALGYCEALEAADRAALFKTYTKVLAQRHGMMATFMAKWSNSYPGQSGHLHISLSRQDGRSVFHDPAKAHDMSDEMRWFIGGQQALMPECLAMIACTVNSYSRLIPGFWAPTSATWGVENRTTSLRVIRGGPSSQRVEYRIAAADINPYIALAAAIGTGLWGIENRIEPDAPIEGTAYEREHAPQRRLPPTLHEAADRLLGSGPARNLFGDAFVEHFAFQCGYCTPGFVNEGQVLLERLAKTPVARAELDTTIREALNGHLCRCTGYVKYHEAMRDVILADPNRYLS